MTSQYWRIVQADVVPLLQYTASIMESLTSPQTTSFTYESLSS